jgi:hypothetical protein
MPLLGREDLELLLSPHSRPCVSLYMPTHRHHPGSEQDPIRFKNLLRRAGELIGVEHGAKAARELLEPVEDMAGPLFWSRQKDGLALFRSEDILVHYRLPVVLAELAVVADTFHVRPLVRFLQGHRRYYVLALAQKEIGLYEGTPEALAPVTVDDMPTSLLDTLGVDRSAGVLNLRTLPAAGSPALFHGHGAPDESRKEDLRRLFREVDRALWSVLRDESVPLVLAGVAYYLPLYREVSRYRGLLDRAVEGSFDGASPQELHARVWPVIREAFASRVEDALAERARAAERGLATEDLVTIGKMVVHGRVRRLLLADGAHAWGSLDPETGAVRLAEGQQDARDDDVLDDLAENVLVRGGDVLAVPAGRLPGGASASGLLRW